MLPTLVLALAPAVGPEVVSIAPTPDGRFLFVAHADGPAAKGTGRVAVWDLSKPGLTAVVGGLPGDLREVRPTADGKRFVLVAGNGWQVSAAEVWDVADGKRVRVLALPAGEWAAPVVSPDGAWVSVVSAGKAKPPGRVLNTATGEPAEAVEKAALKATGSLAFSPDGKRLVAAGPGSYAAFELATGKKVSGWERDPPPLEGLEISLGARVVPLPGKAAVVTVGATGKRRQSFVVRLATETKDWFLGEFWDDASDPVVAPDGRLLVVSGGSRAEAVTVVLRLAADGSPELEDKPEKDRPPYGGGDGKKVPAWRAWDLGAADRAGRELPVVAFSPDGKRLFTGGRDGVRVWDAEKFAPLATLHAGPPPAWRITTPGGALVGSAGEDRDPAKVREALTGGVR